MARLIDADALKAEWPEPTDWMDRDQVLCHITWFRAVIDNMPTIDPVKHGKWIDRRSIAAMNRYECSACKRTTIVDEFMGKPMYAYCPWCGARMKGDE